MSFSFVYPFTTTLSFKYTSLEVLMVTSIFMLLFSIFLINTTMTKVSVISFFTGGLIIALYSFFNKTLNSILVPFIWIFNYVQGKEAENESFAILFTLLFSFVFSLIVYIFTVKKFNFYILFLTGASIFCVQWMFEFFVEDRAYIAFYTFVVSILIYYLLHIYNKKWAHESNDFANPSTFIVFAAPIAIMVLLIAIFIPVKAKPIEWKWLDEKLYFAMNFDSRSGKIFNSKYFNISATGFGDSSNKLGSDVTLDKTLVFKVKSPEKLYLKGRSSDRYTGSSWVKTDTSYYELNNKNNKLNLDTFEFKSCFMLLFRDCLKEAKNPVIFPRYKKQAVEILYEDIKTNSLFSPLKASNLKFDNSDVNDIFVDSEGVLLSRKQLDKGFTYSFDTYNINYGDKNFKEILKMSNRNLYDMYLQQALDDIWNEVYERFIEHYKRYNINPYITKNDINQLVLESTDVENMKENLSLYLNNRINDADIKINNANKKTVDANNKTNDANNKTVVIDNKIIDYDTIIIEAGLYSSHLDIHFNSAVDSFINQISNDNYYADNQNLFEWIISTSTLKDNSNTIYSKYIDLPDSVPKRVKALAASITRNENNDYDKVKAIEEYLSKNYKYNLSPGTVPDGVDFVDYFLFEQKEGYCTYFATAMAVLTRSIGIPSRYVEGYLIPSTKGKDVMYEVTNERAHAWVEVYFEGVGWIPFEATASFSHNLYQPTYTNTPKANTPTPTLSSTPSSNIAPSAKNNLPNQKKKAKIFLNKDLIKIIITVTSIVLFISLIVFFNIFKRKRYISKILKLPKRQAVLKLYEYFLKLLSVQKADINAGETPLDHARRLDNMEMFYPHKLEEITEIFVNARYSRDEITEDELNKVLAFYEPFLKAAKSNIGIVKYTLYMYLLFKF